METLDDALAALLVNPTLKFSDETPYGKYKTYIDEELILLSVESDDNFVISLDLRSCFNKTSQCPIHFALPASKRKVKRVHEAVKFLKDNEKTAGQFFGVLPGFDDLSREAIYKIKS